MSNTHAAGVGVSVVGLQRATPSYIAEKFSDIDTPVTYVDSYNLLLNPATSKTAVDNICYYVYEKGKHIFTSIDWNIYYILQEQLHPLLHQD